MTLLPVTENLTTETFFLICGAANADVIFITQMVEKMLTLSYSLVYISMYAKKVIKFVRASHIYTEY